MFHQYTMPKLDKDTGKWVFEVQNEAEELVERVERDTEQAALKEQKARLINDHLSGRVMTEVKR